MYESHDLTALRAAFDTAFARPRPSPDEDVEAIVAVRSGDLRIALRVAELATIVPCPPLTEVPSASPALCGIAAVRRSLVAVYDITTLVPGGTAGFAAAAPRRAAGTGPLLRSPQRWVVLCGADRTIGLVFDELEAHLHVRRGDVEASPAARLGQVELVTIDGVARPMLRIADLIERIRAARAGRVEEEQ